MRKSQIILVVGGYIAALLWAYATIVSQAFAYSGYTLMWRNAATMVWLVALALLPAFLLPYSLERPSALIMWWLYLAAYIPSILVPPLSLSMPLEELLPLQISLLFCMGLLSFASSGRLLAVRRINISSGVFWSVFIVLWLASLAFIGMSGANLLGNLAALLAGESEYVIRSQYIGQLFDRGPGLGYLLGQVGQALDPYLIAVGIVYRRRMCLLAGIIGQIIVFSLTGFKSVLFSAIFLALLFLLIKRWRLSFGVVLTLGLMAGILLCAVADRVTPNTLFSSLLTRRMLCDPGLLTGFYFEHYSQVPHAGVDYHFIHTGPVRGPSNEIGLTYFGSADVDANANLWAEGFADFGVPGIVGFTLLAAFVIWIYDSISVSRDLELATLLAAMLAFNLSNTSPTTVLLTHGGIAAALLLYLSPSGKQAEALEPEFEAVGDQFVAAAGTPG